MQAIVRELNRDDESSSIGVGTGGSPVVANALFAALDEGDEVIVAAPSGSIFIVAYDSGIETGEVTREVTGM